MSSAFHPIQDANGRLALNQARLRALRKAVGLSQEAMADLCASQHLCISLASIKRAEAGKAVLYRTARHLARFFQIELMLLIGHAPHHDRSSSSASFKFDMPVQWMSVQVVRWS